METYNWVHKGKTDAVKLQTHLKNVHKVDKKNIAVDILHHDTLRKLRAQPISHHEDCCTSCFLKIAPEKKRDRAGQLHADKCTYVRDLVGKIKYLRSKID